MAEELTSQEVNDISIRVALGFAAYYEKIGYPQLAQNIYTLHENGEGATVADEVWADCAANCLPVPSDLVDEYMRLINDKPDLYTEELEVINRLERTDPIWVVVKSA